MEHNCATGLDTPTRAHVAWVCVCVFPCNTTLSNETGLHLNFFFIMDKIRQLQMYTAKTSTSNETGLHTYNASLTLSSLFRVKLLTCSC